MKKAPLRFADEENYSKGKQLSFRDCKIGLVKITLTRIVAPLLLLAGLATSGCSGGNGVQLPPQPQSVSGTLSNGLTVTLAVDDSIIPLGGTLNYTASLTNNTNAPLTFDIWNVGGPSPQAYLVVRNEAGEQIWPDPTQPLPAAPPPPTMTTTLQPGQSITERESLGPFVWRQRGRFGITAGFVAGFRHLEIGPLFVEVR